MAARVLRIGFHWITVLLVTAAFAIAFWRNGLDDPDQRLFWLDMHRTIGLVVLGLTVLRLLVRLFWKVESAMEGTPLLKLVSNASHSALYGLLLAMPLLGWAQSSAKMRKFRLFDHAFPRLMDRNPDLGDILGQWHEALGWAMLALIGLHSLAALYHHFVRRDHVLLDMLRVHPDQR